MFWITAIVRPSKLNDIYERLLNENVAGMTITEVKGFGNQKANIEMYRGNAHASRFVAKIKIEMAVAEVDVERVVQSLVESSKTGSEGDGKVFVNKLEQAIRIRTGEIDQQAI